MAVNLENARVEWDYHNFKYFRRNKTVYSIHINTQITKQTRKYKNTTNNKSLVTYTITINL